MLASNPLFINDPKANLSESNVVWSYNSDPQRIVLESRCMEILVHGSRGSGKTDVLLMSFIKAMIVENRPIRGIIFRPRFPELKEIIHRCQILFGQIFGKQGRYLKNEHVYECPDGSKLQFTHLYDVQQALSHKGFEYDFIGFDELTSWNSLDPYRMLLASTARTKGKNCYVRSTTNPDGLCSQEVQDYFKCPQSDFKEIEHTDIIEGVEYIRRTLSVPLQMKDNPALKENYIANVKAAAINEAQKESWVFGVWGSNKGGLFDDVFKAETHILPKIHSIPSLIRQGWRVGRSFDWGSARPFSVGWYLIVPKDCYMEGVSTEIKKEDIIRFHEYYGWNGTPNKGLNHSVSQIAEAIHEIERQLGVSGYVSGNLSVADPAILGDSEGYNFGKQFNDLGVVFTKFNFSRNNAVGWQAMRELLFHSTRLPRELPGLFVTENCEHFIRTVPRLKRDQKNTETLADGQEDHIADEVKYFCMVRRKQLEAKQQRF